MMTSQVIKVDNAQLFMGWEVCVCTQPVQLLIYDFGGWPNITQAVLCFLSAHQSPILYEFACDMINRNMSHMSKIFNFELLTPFSDNLGVCIKM